LAEWWELGLTGMLTLESDPDYVTVWVCYEDLYWILDFLHKISPNFALEFPWKIQACRPFVTCWKWLALESDPGHSVDLGWIWHQIMECL